MVLGQCEYYLFDFIHGVHDGDGDVCSADCGKAITVKQLGGVMPRVTSEV